VVVVTGWPTAELDGIARLRVLAAGLPGAVLHERTLAAPYDEVWGFLADLERSAPAFDSDVESLRVLRRQGDRLLIEATNPWRLVRWRLRFDVDLTDGWCWMVSRPQLYIVGMAAEPAGAHSTRFGHLEGLVVPGSRMRRAAASPLLALSRWRHRHHVPRDVDRIERCLGLARDG
jgi:hypothetical protein